MKDTQSHNSIPQCERCLLIRAAWRGQIHNTVILLQQGVLFNNSTFCEFDVDWIYVRRLRADHVIHSGFASPKTAYTIRQSELWRHTNEKFKRAADPKKVYQSGFLVLCV